MYGFWGQIHSITGFCLLYLVTNYMGFFFLYALVPVICSHSANPSLPLAQVITLFICIGLHLPSTSILQVPGWHWNYIFSTDIITSRWGKYDYFHFENQQSEAQKRVGHVSEITVLVSAVLWITLFSWAPKPTLFHHLPYVPKMNGEKPYFSLV